MLSYSTDRALESGHAAPSIVCDGCDAEPSIPAASSAAEYEAFTEAAGWKHYAFSKHYCPVCRNLPMDPWGNLLRIELAGPPWPPPFVGPPWPPPYPGGDTLGMIDRHLKYDKQSLSRLYANSRVLALLTRSAP